MRAIVTGATGFIGRHVVGALVRRGHAVTAVARNPRRVPDLQWPDAVQFVCCDVHTAGLDVRSVFGPADVIVHLAWPGLPHYKALYHVEETLFADYRFLKSAVSSGYGHLLVTGTCLEYGMQTGELHENIETRPTTSYGLAKDTLRRLLEMLRSECPFILQWVRLFYVCGPGQHAGSLLSQLERALDRGDKEFPMSAGEQLRDYTRVEKVAAEIVRLVEQPEQTGIVNICSGKPISVRRLVEEFIAARGKQIRLKLGHYPAPDYEPMAFWGGRSRMQNSEGRD
jgi:dTDP-6-deoxy-L-talose 4-dehydrogenase (NAD+)